MQGQLWLFDEPPASDPRTPADLASALAEEREIAFFDLPCRSLLNRCTSRRMPFQWTINPYRDCEFGCTYCYARYSHEFLGMSGWRDFQEKIFVKQDAPALLPRDLDRRRPGEGSIAIGTVTDPYQPAERRYRVTRRILEELVRHRDLDVSITTKSALITRDLDLLRAIAGRNGLTINVSLITLHRRFARLLEPRAPTPQRRLATIRALAEAGLKVGVFAMPVLPGLTDSHRSLDSLVRRSADAGATHFSAQMLFLRGTARDGFISWLAREFPALAAPYRRLYARSAYLSRPRRERLSLQVASLRRKYGIPGDRRAGAPEPAAGTTLAFGW